MSETTEHTAATLKLMQVNGQLEARCERLEGALQKIGDWPLGGNDHNKWRQFAREALSDTAQPCKGCGGTGEIDPGSAAACPLCNGSGEEPRFDPVAEMRERAAKLCDNKALCHKGTTSLFGDEAALQLSKAIRALPIDPETGGK